MHAARMITKNPISGPSRECSGLEAVGVAADGVLVIGGAGGVGGVGVIGGATGAVEGSGVEGADEGAAAGGADGVVGVGGVMSGILFVG